ncbi:MAG: hypothetical protein Aurels2KO_06350 [Aureliella sp.]
MRSPQENYSATAKLICSFTQKLLLAVFVLAASVPTHAWSQESDSPTKTVKRGLSGELEFSHPSSTLRAISDQSVDAPMLVRLERSGQDEEGSLYTLRFFGAVAGDYDLRDFVVESDGSPLTGESALQPLSVGIVSQLPPDHGTSLYEIDDPTLQAPSGYRAALILFGVLWAAVPITWGIIRWRSREPIQEETPERIPTLSDHLRPLVQRASQGQMTVKEQSRLELLIYTFWQRRLDLPESLIDALPIMRQHDEAGGLLLSLESWIHTDAATRSAISSEALEALLAPYCETPAEQLQPEPASISGDAA